MPTEEQSVDARLTIVEYRMDKGEEATRELRADYTEGHQKLSLTLQGIEKNLAAIKWMALGAGVVSAAQAIGIDKAAALFKIFF